MSAEGAGLKTGDILMALDGKTIGDVLQIQAAVRAHRIGETISAEYLPPARV